MYWFYKRAVLIIQKHCIVYANVLCWLQKGFVFIIRMYWIYKHILIIQIYCIYDTKILYDYTTYCIDFTNRFYWSCICILLILQTSCVDYTNIFYKLYKYIVLIIKKNVFYWLCRSIVLFIQTYCIDLINILYWLYKNFIDNRDINTDIKLTISSFATIFILMSLNLYSCAYAFSFS